MFKKTILLTALCASSIGLSGCSSMWKMASDFSADMSEFTKFSFLRGSSTKDDVSFAENTVDAETGVYKTEVGEYVPTEVYTETFEEVVYANGDVAAVVDTSPIPCPDGTYLTEDETCMSLDVDTYDFAELDAQNVSGPVDTSQHDCPEETYLNDKNQCMFFETETFDFEDDVNFTAQTVDTSPLPCPDETYLTADGTCQFLNSEPTDFALNTDELTTDKTQMTNYVTKKTPVMPAVSAVPSKAVATNLAIECPPGFKTNGNNSCMYLGAELQE